MTTKFKTILSLTLTLLFLGPTAHAAFSSSVALTLPSRPNQKHFIFVDGGRRVVDVGAGEPSRIFDITNDKNFLLMTGEPEMGNQTLVERRSTHEVFYFGDQAEDQEDLSIRRYLRGYNLAGDDVVPTYSQRLYMGYQYDAPVFVLALSLDETTLYFANTTESTIQSVNLMNDTEGAPLKLPDMVGAIASVREILYKGNKVLAVTSQDEDGILTLAYYDLKSLKNVFQLTSEDLGLQSLGYKDYTRNVELSPNADKAVFCQIDRCVLVNLLKQNIVADLHIDGSIESAATFSPDGRYLFVTEYDASNTLFSVVNTTDGSSALSQIPMAASLTSKAFLTADKKYFVLMHSDRILLLSAADGHLVQESAQLPADVEFDDLVYMNESPTAIQFMVTKTTGLVEKWELVP